jgi:hypothetical protein
MFQGGAGDHTGAQSGTHQQHHQVRHHHGHHNIPQQQAGGAAVSPNIAQPALGFSPMAMFSQLGNLHQGFSNFGGFGGGGFGGFDLQSLKPKLQQFKSQFKTMIPAYQSQLAHINVMLCHNRTQKLEAFYRECGTSERHCEWEQKRSILTKRSQTYVADESVVEDAPPSVESEHVCYSTNHVCVGNTETCISERNCDAAMKIREVVKENSKTSAIMSISHINNCHMESQAITDSSKMSQMFFGVGFATYDESGQNLECRSVRASDFKLIFLWKNTSEALTGPGVCQTPPDQDRKSVQLDDVETLKEVVSWPKQCKTLASKDGGFQLKSFMNTHVPNSHYTSFFQPPFNFADNFEPQLSSNGMVVTGTVNA